MSTTTRTETPRMVAFPRIFHHRPTGHFYLQVRWAVGAESWGGWYGPFETIDALHQWIRGLAVVQADLEEVAFSTLGLPDTLATLDTPANHAQRLGGS